MEKKQNVPALRFQGFSGEWKRQRFGEVATFINGRAYAQSELLSAGKYKVLRVGNFYTNSAWYYSNLELSDKYYANRGDLLYTWSATFGPHIWDGDKVIYHYHIWKIEVKEQLEKLFFLQLLERDKKNLLNDTNGSTMVHITKLGMENKTDFIPNNIDEQSKIGQFCSQINCKIEKEKRKIQKLQQFRQAMLTKLFPREGAAEPELRFRGFSGKWKQNKLGDLVVRITRKNSNMESDLPLTISAVLGLVSQREYFNNRVASGDVSRYYLIKKGEFAYNKSYSDGYPFGAVKRLDKYDKGVLSTLYIIFSPKKDAVQSDYLAAYYDTTGWYKEVAARAAEGARNHGLLNISPDDFFDTMLKLPESKEEQQQIGTFFKNLDDFISLQQKKLERMQRLKAALLEKLFV